MKLQQHAAASAVVSGALFALSRSWPIAASSFVAGVLVDLDHLLDFWREYGLRADVRRIFRVCHEHKLRRAVLVLHGWEWILAGAALCALTRGNPWVVGAVLGLGQHLILDQVFNRPNPLGYFLVWRARRGFFLDRLFERD